MCSSSDNLSVDDTSRLVDPDSLLGSLDPARHHGAESRTHAVRTVVLGELHACSAFVISRRVERGAKRRAGQDKARANLASPVHDGGLGTVHVEAAHVTLRAMRQQKRGVYQQATYELLEQTSADEPLGAERTHRTVVTRRRHNHAGIW
jgi:hypothetical protein